MGGVMKWSKAIKTCFLQYTVCYYNFFSLLPRWPVPVGYAGAGGVAVWPRPDPAHPPGGEAGTHHLPGHAGGPHGGTGGGGEDREGIGWFYVSAKG